MMRETLDAYLDGELAASERAGVERLLASDAAVARLLARMKAQRALRQAAFASYQPTEAEARALAATTLAALQDSGPVGYVGRWIRRAGAVAAALIMVAASFVAGRMTSPANPGDGQVAGASPTVIYRVMYVDSAGELQVPEFASLDEANDFISKHDLKRSDAQVAAMPVDLNRPGSF